MRQPVNLIPLSAQGRARNGRVTIAPTTTKVTKGRCKSKTEQEYESSCVLLNAARGKVVKVRYEPLRLTLAPRTTYTPDFMLTYESGLVELHEVKGSWKVPHQEDARAKLKIAAALYPEFHFVCAVKVKGGGWEFEEFRP